MVSPICCNVHAVSASRVKGALSEMLTESDREIAMQKARERVANGNERELLNWYYYFIRQSQDRQERTARTTHKLEGF